MRVTEKNPIFKTCCQGLGMGGGLCLVTAMDYKPQLREEKAAVLLRTFALIFSAHPYCARKFTCPVMHRARALSTKMNNDRADGHCCSFDWI